MNAQFSPEETAIPRLGQAKVESPLSIGRFISDDAGILVQTSKEDMDNICSTPLFFEEAGPRKLLYFDPSKVRCAIVTCGGLCPGINDVIRAIVMEAVHHYNVSGVVGIRYGLEGFIPKYKHDIVQLTPDFVADIHEFGGTILSSSRGPQPSEDMVDALERMNIGILFLIGGDGTMRAAARLQNEIASRNLKISVIGIPKTIDNDIDYVSPSFGFDTAVDKATEAIRCAHVEALGANFGVGLVKLMGRESGFIAAQATLALKEVNFCLIPEDRFEFRGENGLFRHLEDRLVRRKHAVIVVAEGAGQELCETTGKKDISGNPVLGDISATLRKEIKAYFDEKGMPLTLKFIDPSYIIRSVPANSNDRIYCGFLGQNAVHAAMAGRTGMVVTKWNNQYVHLPFGLITKRRKKIDVTSNYWRAVLETTGQPAKMYSDGQSA